MRGEIYHLLKVKLKISDLKYLNFCYLWVALPFRNVWIRHCIVLRPALEYLPIWKSDFRWSVIQFQSLIGTYDIWVGRGVTVHFVAPAHYVAPAYFVSLAHFVAQVMTFIINNYTVIMVLRWKICIGSSLSLKGVSEKGIGVERK
jgi:hypothetical protein